MESAIQSWEKNRIMSSANLVSSRSIATHFEIHYFSTYFFALLAARTNL